MPNVGKFQFNDGLTNNPARKIFNTDYVDNFERIDELFDKCVALTKLVSAYPGGTNLLDVEEAQFFQLNDPIVLRTPSGSIYATRVAATPTTLQSLQIDPIPDPLPINTVISHADPEILAARGTFPTLSDRLNSISQITGNDLNVHRTESNAHQAINISTTGSFANVQLYLDNLNTTKLNASVLSTINASIALGDATVTSGYQSADTLLQNNFDAQQTDQNKRINLYTNVGNYIQRLSNGSPIFPNIIYTPGLAVVQEVINNLKSATPINYPTNLTLTAFVADTFSSNNYLYGLGGYNGSVAVTNVYRTLINTDGTLSGWIAQASLPIAGWSNNGGCILDTSTGDRRMLFVTGGNNKVYASNLLNGSNGTISSWNALVNLPISPTRPAISSVKIGASSYLYIRSNSDNNIMYWRRWNESIVNIDGPNYRVAVGGPISRSTSMISYSSNLFLVGGSKEIYLVKLNFAGEPDFINLGELLPKVLHFPKLAIKTYLGKDYLFITGGNSGGDFSATPLEYDTYIFEIDSFGKLKYRKTFISSLITGASASGFANIRVNNNDMFYIHSGNGSTGVGAVTQSMKLNRNVNLLPTTVVVSGGEYIINNEVVDSYALQNFTNVISNDAIDFNINKQLLAIKNGPTKEFRLVNVGTISDPNSLFIADITIDSTTGLGSTIFYDTNILQDILNTNNHVNNAILKGCELSITNPITINVGSGLFDINGKIFGTTGISLNLTTQTDFEVNKLGPTYLQHTFEHNISHGSMCNISFTNGKRYIYRIGGYDGIPQPTCQFGELNSDGLLLTGIRGTAAFLPVGSQSINAAIPIVLNNGDRRIFTVAGGQNTMYLSNVINSADGNINSWTQYGTLLPWTSSTPWAKMLDISGTKYIYIFSGGTGAHLLTRYTFNNNDGSISANTNFNFSITLDQCGYAFLDNKFVYIIGGMNGATITNDIYRGSIDSSGNVTWSTIPIGKLFNNLILFNSEIIKIGNDHYLYIFGGNSRDVFDTVGSSNGIARIRLNSTTGDLEGNWEFMAMGLEVPSEQGSGCVVEANNNILYYKGTGVSPNGSISDSNKVELIPIYSKKYIGRSLPYLERSGNGTVSIKLTKQWEDSVNSLTLLGMIDSDGINILKTINIAKNRKFDSGWFYATENNRYVFEHNLFYPIKNTKVLFRENYGSPETLVNDHDNSNIGINVWNRNNRRFTTVSIGTNGINFVISDSQVASTGTYHVGQLRLILET